MEVHCKMPKKKIATIIALCLVGALILSACSGREKQGEKQNVSGTIIAAGSTAMQPLVEEAANQFMAKNPGIQVQVQGGGSGTGLKLVSDGTVQIGNSDVPAENKLDKEKAKELIPHKVCVVGFAVIVNPAVKVDNLTKDQLIGIFTGKITNWKEVGGDDLKIVVINRPAGSGTRATFTKYALDGREETQGMALTQDSSGTVKKAVADTPGAISYIALSYVDSSVKVVKLDGVEPSKENIVEGKYPVWSYEYMYTKGEAAGVVKTFIDYMLGDEVKPIIEKLGYIPIGDMKVTR